MRQLIILQYELWRLLRVVVDVKEVVVFGISGLLGILLVLEKRRQVFVDAVHRKPLVLHLPSCLHFGPGHDLALPEWRLSFLIFGVWVAGVTAVRNDEALQGGLLWLHAEVAVDLRC